MRMIAGLVHDLVTARLTTAIQMRADRILVAGLDERIAPAPIGQKRLG